MSKIAQYLVAPTKQSTNVLHDLQDILQVSAFLYD